MTDLPSLPAPPVPKGAAKGVATALNAPPECGGCGAKVGAGALAEALAAMPSTTRNDIVQGAGDDAAILSIAGQEQVITTDHLRGFALDPALVARIALHHAAGDVLAMGAAPQAALAQIILPPMAPRLQTRALIEVMAAAGGAAAELGLEIAGGHSTEGAELSIGFTVTGLLSAPAKTLGAAQAGDVLVLTRPIGSGVLLAGEMAMLAKGADIASRWATRCQPLAEIARALAQHAHAMTDVTGFGLAGHLGGICRASGLGAQLELDALPYFSGARDLAARGVASSLAPSNRTAAAPLLTDLDQAADALMFAPQTAGGLLAAVPEAVADEAIAAGAWRIGQMLKGHARIELS